jgi:hypothetical protein
VHQFGWFLHVPYYSPSNSDSAVTRRSRPSSPPRSPRRSRTGVVISMSWGQRAGAGTLRQISGCEGLAPDLTLLRSGGSSES